MKNLINQLGFDESFTLKTITAVTGLMNHDMIYVYHHLHKGSLVELIKQNENINGDPVYDVFYNKFKLGECIVSGIMKSFYLSERSIYGEIAGLSKDKYMPIKELDIQLSVQSLKKVS